jgi:hypothetical protein
MRTAATVASAPSAKVTAESTRAGGRAGEGDGFTETGRDDDAAAEAGAVEVAIDDESGVAGTAMTYAAARTARKAITRIEADKIFLFTFCVRGGRKSGGQAWNFLANSRAAR